MLIAPTNKVAPPRPKPKPQKFIAESIRALEPEQSILVKDGNNNSIKAIVSRLRKQFKGKRRFASAKETTGVRVWRLA